jgi:hypothetical protein
MLKAKLGNYLKTFEALFIERFAPSSFLQGIGRKTDGTRNMGSCKAHHLALPTESFYQRTSTA